MIINAKELLILFYLVNVFFFFRYFEAETIPRIKHTKKGLLSMVNCGDGMLGSQFFLTLGKALNLIFMFVIS